MRMLAATLLLLCGTAADAADWRRLATSADRTRLRGWRDAWLAGLAAARQDPEGAAAIASDPVLFDPDRGLFDPLPPGGAYRCRTIKLGRQGRLGLAYVAYGWFGCRIGSGPEPVTLAKTSGSQRPVGLIHADTDARGVFLGSLALGDEVHPIAYGRDRSRDMAGIVERIGERRWRLVLPYPAFESTIDLIELVPADQPAGGAVR